jgi:hypothetical protein
VYSCLYFDSDLRHGNLPSDRNTTTPSISLNTTQAAKRSTSPEGDLNTSFDSQELGDNSRSQSPASPVDKQRPESPTRTMSGTYVRPTSPVRANAPWKRPTSPIRTFSGNSDSPMNGKNDHPISPMSTGSSSNSPSRWKPSGGGTICPACQKQVYFAEQASHPAHRDMSVALRKVRLKPSERPGTSFVSDVLNANHLSNLVD